MDLHLLDLFYVFSSYAEWGFSHPIILNITLYGIECVLNFSVVLQIMLVCFVLKPQS